MRASLEFCSEPTDVLTTIAQVPRTNAHGFFPFGRANMIRSDDVFAAFDGRHHYKKTRFFFVKSAM
jgi:hypothetical protein